MYRVRDYLLSTIFYPGTPLVFSHTLSLTHAREDAPRVRRTPEPSRGIRLTRSSPADSALWSATVPWHLARAVTCRGPGLWFSHPLPTAADGWCLP